MQTFKKIKYYYGKELYSNSHLAVFLSVGVITQTEYEEIIQGGKQWQET